MTEYIPKSTLVAEIEKRRESNAKERYFGRLVEDNYFLDFLDILEVKEVDLEKELKSFLDNIEGVPRMWHSDEQIEWAKDIAKHFFELGMAVRNEA